MVLVGYGRGIVMIPLRFALVETREVAQWKRKVGWEKYADEARSKWKDVLPHCPVLSQREMRPPARAACMSLTSHSVKAHPMR